MDVILQEASGTVVLECTAHDLNMEPGMYLICTKSNRYETFVHLKFSQNYFRISYRDKKLML